MDFTEQEIDLIKTYLSSDLKEQWISNIDKFIIHSILQKLENK